MRNLLVVAFLFAVVLPNVLPSQAFSSRLDALKATVSVNLNTPLFVSDDRFLSLGMDSNLIRDRWETFDFNSVKLKTLAKGLTPAYMRLMGTDGDRMIFVRDDIPQKSWTEKLKGWPFPATKFNMTSSDWDSINTWTAEVGWRLLFGINAQTRKPLPDGNGTYWDASNTLELLDYSVERGYASHLDFEFGNEPNRWPLHKDMVLVPPSKLGEEFLSLKKLLVKFYGSSFQNALLIGPDCAGNGSPNWLTAFLNVSGKVLNATTFHQYYGNRELSHLNNYTDPKLLDTYKEDLQEVLKNVKSSSSPNLRIWNGETASTSSAPGNGIDMTYVAGFMLLDKLGLSARLGLSLVVRQTFYGFWFALVDQQFEPRPNYWLSLMFKRLIGREVLDGQVTMPGSVNDPARLRLYAHCTSERSGYPQGSVVIYAMNLFNDTVTLNFNSSLSGNLHQFLWTAPNGNLTSEGILLNGQMVKMADDSTLPTFKPVIKKTSDGMEMPNYSMAYIVFPDVKVKKCISGFRIR